MACLLALDGNRNSLTKLLIPKRCFFQSLLLLSFLVKNGSERVVTGAREHLYDLRGLENYTFTDEHGKDQGLNGKYLLTQYELSNVWKFIHYVSPSE